MVKHGVALHAFVLDLSGNSVPPVQLGPCLPPSLSGSEALGFPLNVMAITLHIKVQCTGVSEVAWQGGVRRACREGSLSPDAGDQGDRWEHIQEHVRAKVNMCD